MTSLPFYTPHCPIYCFAVFIFDAKLTIKLCFFFIAFNMPCYLNNVQDIFLINLNFFTSKVFNFCHLVVLSHCHSYVIFQSYMNIVNVLIPIYSMKHVYVFSS